jgi:hypothetical protein
LTFSVLITRQVRPRVESALLAAADSLVNRVTVWTMAFP